MQPALRSTRKARMFLVIGLLSLLEGLSQHRLLDRQFAQVAQLTTPKTTESGKETLPSTTIAVTAIANWRRHGRTQPML